MLVELEAFSLSDPVFFDSESRWGEDSTAFPQTRGPVPPGWRRRAHEVWVELAPAGHQLPRQGWKVHVSACPDNAQRVVGAAYDHCVARRIPFKFLRSHHVLRAHSLKYADRSSSGKLVTIYPSDEAQLRTVLEELSSALSGEPGPYILTDLRWGSGPLYVRYGAFVALFCPDENEQIVPALVGPDGTLQPDRRTPVFSVPDWVRVPDFFGPHLAARQDGDVDFPYQPENALHFSNGGGVYLARRLADHRQVVLKEARPHAGLDAAGRDAVTRLRAERDALRRLAGIPGVPDLYEYRTVWEHEFLVQEYLPGDSLFGWLSDNHPLVRATPTAADLERYAARVVHVADQVERVVAAIHARGMAIGDLHPNNILVDADDRITLIDFETATGACEKPPVQIGLPGFLCPARSGPAGDRYAVAAIRLWLLLPFIELTALVPRKVERYLADAAERFPVPSTYVDAIRAELVPPPDLPGTAPLGDAIELGLGLEQPQPDWSIARKSLAEAILSSATPQRRDRLFPGDVQQFVADGLGIGFGFGAAGVLWALDVAGFGRHPAHEQWLRAAARRVPSARPGFYDGLFGLAFTLDHLGHGDAAEPVLDQAIAACRELRDVSLHSGLAGAGLCLLHFADRTGESGYLDPAYRVADRLATAVRGEQPHGVDQWIGHSGAPAAHRRSRAGLLRGWSGPALLFLRLFRHTGDAGYRDLAITALHRDLDLCRTAPDGSLQVDVGWALLPYLDVGSAGIALVTAEALACLEDDRLAEALPALARACQPEVVFEAQLFSGRAGLIAALAKLDVQRPDLDLGPSIARHLRRLVWHATSYQGRLAFPGSKLRRLSMDLATGGAGVLLALGTVVDGDHELLPFLGGRTAGHRPAPYPLARGGDAAGAGLQLAGPGGSGPGARRSLQGDQRRHLLRSHRGLTPSLPN